MANAAEPARDSSQMAGPEARGFGVAKPCLGPPRRFVKPVVERRAAKADGPSAIAAPPRAQGRFTRGSRRSCTPRSAPSPPPAPLGRQPGTEQLSHGRPATRVALQAPNWPPAQPIVERRGGGYTREREGGLREREKEREDGGLPNSAAESIRTLSANRNQE